MTLDEFLVALKKTPRDWTEQRGLITRFGRGGFPQCPISCLRNRYCTEWRGVARELGLRERTAERIVDAADHKGNPRLRVKLLKACGLA